MARKKGIGYTNSTATESVKHKDKRANIPTRELADFVIKEEQAPYVMTYPRDQSLDPQLVWKGKDEQDRQDLPVPTVPIYIQEKISPQALIENLRSEQAKKSPATQPNLFADFNGIEFEQLVEFYQHEQNWANRMILGDSLLVMNSLAEKEGLKGKVQMIYIDPPYGIKFGSNWQISTRKRDVKDGKAEDATRQPEQIKAFRDTWKLGIHSYLSYLRDRLVVARELLTETGSIFVQIGDENVHLVRCLMDEVFASENFVSLITFRKKTMPLGAKYLEEICDYLVFYAKNKNLVKYRQLFEDMNVEGDSHWNYYEGKDGKREKLSLEQIMNHKFLPEGVDLFQLVSMSPIGYDPNRVFKIEVEGKSFLPPQNKSWKTDPEGAEKLKIARRLIPYADGRTLRYVLKLSDYPISPVTALWSTTSAPVDMSYVVETNVKVVQRCILMTTDPGDLVLDPTCGSGTTAYVAEQWGRRWITIDTSRVALALARTRLMAAKYPYYLLADSPEGVKREMEVTGKIPPNPPLAKGGEGGILYKTEGDIKEGMTREEIDAAIARHAETETLYDQPYEDNKRIRVSGPFTMESLSPHRVLTTDEERPASEQEAAKVAGPGQFETMILENLNKAGVKNRVKQERLTFDRLEPYAGVYLHGEGQYTEGGKSRRVAICIGPEHGTVGPELVKDAAKEAVKGIGFDLLVICGFAFDPHVSEEAKRFGKLTVLMARMNPDLAMGDELLKKTGAGNLFMVFGEPDLEIKQQKDGKITVEIKGVDVYDPTTGQIRNHTTDDIACWFIDTDYNEESFFVRHAYFCGADEPYEKLKRALRAEIDEGVWSTLYSTKSRPFDQPAKGKIAVKVINHYGDEVLKVYKV